MLTALQFSLTGCVPQKQVIWDVNNVSQEEIFQLESLLKKEYSEIHDETFKQTDYRNFKFLNNTKIFIRIKLYNTSELRIIYLEHSNFQDPDNFSPYAQRQLELLDDGLKSIFGNRLIVIHK
jgi:hypothetical protein